MTNLYLLSLQQHKTNTCGKSRAASVQVQSGALVAAGAVVQPNTVVEAGQVWGGNPAKYIRDLKQNEKDFMHKSAESYCALGAEHFNATKDGPAGFKSL